MQWFNNMKVSQKLVLGFVLVSVIAGTIGIVGYNSIESGQKNIISLYNDRLVPIRDLGYANAAFLRIQTSLHEMVLMGLSKNTSELQDLSRTIDEDTETISKLIEGYSKTVLVKEEQETLPKFQEARIKYLPLRNKAIEQAVKMNTEQALATIDGEMDGYQMEMRQTLRKLIDVNAKVAEDLYKEAERAGEDAQRFMIILIVLGVVISIVLGLSIARAISRPLEQGVEFARKIADGDLTSSLSISSRDEIGQLADALNGMSQALRKNMANISQTASTLSNSSGGLSAVAAQLASSSEEMSSQVETVAAATEQVTSSVGTVASASEESSSVVQNIAAMTEEMSSTFNNIAKLSRNASDKVGGVAQMGQDMSGAVASVAAAIEEMTASLNEVAKNTTQASRISNRASSNAADINVKMETLVKASQQIGKVVGVIKDIADQTNMLALNATIEAAGAGDAGKGFAVVAGEVKELARQSADATDEIAGQIENIQKSTKDVVDAIGEIGKIIGEIAVINETIASSVQEQGRTTNEISRTVASNAEMARGVAVNAQDVSKLVNEIAGSTGEASQAASEVAKNVEETARGVKEIARSAVEAAHGVQDISRNIQGISVASSQTASGAGQTNESARELSRMSATLMEIVKQFRI